MAMQKNNISIFRHFFQWLPPQIPGLNILQVMEIQSPQGSEQNGSGFFCRGFIRVVDSVLLLLFVDSLFRGWNQAKMAACHMS